MSAASSKTSSVLGKTTHKSIQKLSATASGTIKKDRLVQKLQHLHVEGTAKTEQKTAVSYAAKASTGSQNTASNAVARPPASSRILKARPSSSIYQPQRFPNSSSRYGERYAQNQRGYPHPAGSAFGGVGDRRPAHWPRRYSQISTLSIAHDREIGVLHRAVEFKEGVIFHAPWHSADGREDEASFSGNHSVTKVGRVCSKVRKFIVLAAFSQHALVLPIFTHNGIGLSRKPNKDEFISIRDLKHKDTAAGPESSHDCIWADNYPDYKTLGGWWDMKDTASVHFTNICAHNYLVKCTILGKVTPSSMRYLKQIFRETIERVVKLDD